MIIENYPIIVPFVSIFLAELAKAAIDMITNRKKVRFINPGGMPSGHSAFVSSAVVVVAFREGLNSSLFMLSVIVALVVMYDAVNLRNEAGLHARALNKLVGSSKLEESLGHTKYEVLAGSAFGTMIAFLMMIF